MVIGLDPRRLDLFRIEVEELFRAGKRQVRLDYANSQENIREALARIGDFLSAEGQTRRT